MADEKPAVAPRPAKADAAPPAPVEDVYGLRERFGAGILEMVAPRGYITVTVPRENLVDVCRFLKEERGFAFLILVTGVDREDHLESVLHLGKVDAPETVVVKVSLPYEDARLPSITPLWQGANWHEREAYDLLGIVYEGHPDLRRILLADEWDEYPHPLRKEFKLQTFDARFVITE